jgi:MFS transporter, DHA2 family, glioxin efflux transporter
MDPSAPPVSAIELQPTANTSADNEASIGHPTEQYPAGFRFVTLTIGLILSIFLAALDSSILGTAIPKITDHFGTVKDVGWYSTAYWITNAAFQSTWGRAVSFGIKL